LNGRAFKTSEWSRTGRPIIRIQDLTGSNRNPNFFEGKVEDRYVVQPGDLLISWSATLGAYIWEGPEAVLNQHIFKVESKINKRFHYHLVRKRIAELKRSAHGSGMVHVTKGTFDSTPVAIPEDEKFQQRLADAIDTADAQCAGAAAHLAAAKRTVERFRHVLLIAACSGRLTADWRENKDLRSGAELVEAARERRIAELGHRFREPEANHHANLADYPASWEASQLGLLLTEIKYGTSKRSQYGGNGVPILRIPNVSGDSLDTTDLKYAVLDPPEAEALRLGVGDLLMIRSNGSAQLVGKTVVVGEGAEGMGYAGYLMRLRTDPDAMAPPFLAQALAAPQVRHQIEMPLRSTSGVNNINTGEVRGLVVPVPPLEEQAEIVRRVDQLLAVADGLDQRIEAASDRVERSSQAVLAKAFRGELVSVTGS
jgi:type I restriction enzyme S subunit